MKGGHKSNNKDIFEQINKEFSFLDDFETYIVILIKLFPRSTKAGHHN
jgi:hypothetical protein